MCFSSVLFGLFGRARSASEAALIFAPLAACEGGALGGGIQTESAVTNPVDRMSLVIVTSLSRGKGKLYRRVVCRVRRKEEDQELGVAEPKLEKR